MYRKLLSVKWLLDSWHRSSKQATKELSGKWKWGVSLVETQSVFSTILSQ